MACSGATNARLVGYKSWLERDHLLALDLDPSVVGLASQPFRLDFGLDGGHRWHILDYFVRLSDGTGLVVDVRPDERIRECDQEVFTATETACASVGWGHRRVGGLPRAFVANLPWLSGYRHPRCLDPAHAQAMQEYSRARLRCDFEGKAVRTHKTGILRLGDRVEFDGKDYVFAALNGEVAELRAIRKHQ